MANMKSNAPVSQSATELIHTKGQLLLEKAEVTACISSLDSEIASLHDLLSTLKSDEQIDSASLTEYRSRVYSALSETSGLLAEAVETVREKTDAWKRRNVMGKEERNDMSECVRLFRELEDIRHANSTKHNQLHRLHCPPCHKRLSPTNCPVCLSSSLYQ